MVFVVLLPFFAALYLFIASFFNQKTYAWEVGVVTLSVTFLNIVSMTIKSLFQSQFYTAVLFDFFTLGEQRYQWQLYLDLTDIFLSVFVVFSALMSLFFVKDYLPEEKMNRFMIFLLGLMSSLIVTIGAKNFLQFFTGIEVSLLFCYLLLMLFHEKQAVRQAGVNFLVWQTLADIPLFLAVFMLISKTQTLLFPSVSDVLMTDAETVLFAVLILLSVSSKLLLFGTDTLISQITSVSFPALGFVLPAGLGALGVYTLFWFYPFFENTQTVQNIFLIWGALTAFTGALMACSQTNLKMLFCKVLMSFFGFVLCVFALMGREVGFCAYVALITPMIGLVFCLGSVVLSLEAEEDLLRMGDLKKTMPFTFKMMLLFCLCCMGFPYIGNFVVVETLYHHFQGQMFGSCLLTLYLFLISWVFGRLLFHVFFAKSKVAPRIKLKMKSLSKTMKVPLIVLVVCSLSQAFVFERSILPELTNISSTNALLLSFLSVMGLPLSILFFKRREALNVVPSVFARGFNLFCLKGFYLTTVYEKVIKTPCLRLADFAWRFASAELLTEKLPKALGKMAQKTQEKDVKVFSAFLSWVLTGLFVLLLCLFLLQIGGLL